MAIGTISNLKLYNDYINGNFAEAFAQKSDILNAGSNGALLLRTEAMAGDYSYESFFTEPAAVARRDPTDTTTDLTDNVLAQDEIVGVKVCRTHHNAMTRNSWLKVGADPALFGRIYGEQLADAIQKEMVDRALACAHAAISAQSALLHDASDGTLATSDLITGLSKRGDRADGIVTFVGHSAPYFNLVNNQLSANTDGVSVFNIQRAEAVTLGRPYVMTDSASLTISATGTRYITLGLAKNAVEIIMTEAPYTAMEEVTGKANIFQRFQTEYAFTIKVKGAKWDVSNGASNPTNATLATTTNWDRAVSDNKNLAGVWIRSQ